MVSDHREAGSYGPSQTKTIIDHLASFQVVANATYFLVILLYTASLQYNPQYSLQSTTQSQHSLQHTLQGDDIAIQPCVLSAFHGRRHGIRKMVVSGLRYGKRKLVTRTSRRVPAIQTAGY
jgi:hypothetical protein